LPEVISPGIAAGKLALPNEDFDIAGNLSFRVCAPAVAGELGLLEKLASRALARVVRHGALHP
jgi:hypothetical protein